MADNSSDENGVRSSVFRHPFSINEARWPFVSVAAMWRFQAVRLRTCKSSSELAGCPCNVASKYHALSAAFTFGFSGLTAFIVLDSDSRRPPYDNLLAVREN